MKCGLVTPWKVFRTFLTVTIITIAIADMFPLRGEEGGSAALITMCSAAVFTLGLVSRLKKDYPSVATVASIFLAAAAGWFWFVSEQPVDLTKTEVLNQLLITAGISGVFGLIGAGVHIEVLRRRKNREMDSDPPHSVA